MPTSKSGDITNAVDTIPHSEKGSRTLEQIRLEEARVTNVLCFLLAFGLITASAVTFCITKSPLSFGFLSGLALIRAFRRRQEEFAFPLSPEDLQIRLKELDVEAKRIEKQSTTASHPLFSWLGRLFGKVGT